MARVGRCVNFGSCARADSRELIEVPESEDFVCPDAECARPLQEADGTPGGRPIRKLALGGLAVALLVGAGAWLLMPTGPPPEPTSSPSASQPATSDPTPAPASACRPAPTTADTVARAREHIAQAMRHAAASRPADAQREFEAAQALAPQWPGLHNQVAAARLAQKDLAGARVAITNELRLLECLRTLDDVTLATLEPTGAAQPAGGSPAQRARKQLDEVEAHTRYNLACAHAASNQIEPALTELRLAVARGFRNRQALLDDADLAPVRSQPAFKEVLASLK